MKELNLNSETLIECMLKRNGGTSVDFGYHGAKAIKYKFLPLDPNDPDSPHVADVDNEAHYERLLSIREAYRKYSSEQEYEPIINIPAPKNDEDYSSKNQFDDLLSVELNTVSNEWLEQFSGEILGIAHTQKQELYDMAVEQYGLEITYKTTTANEIIRKIATARQAEEKAANEALNK